MTRDLPGEQTRIGSPSSLASDNASGICPQAMDYLQRANASDDLAYGDDVWTRRACDAFRTLFETDCEVFFVFNGTAANSLALAASCRPYHGVICHELSHIATDECGAPGFFAGGTGLLTTASTDGRVTPDDITAHMARSGDLHAIQPRMVSLTQATEIGTLYSSEQLGAIHSRAAAHNLHIHMDGARFANACAALDAPPAELSWRAGVDVLCFSGTKNGLPLGEAVIFFNPELARDFQYRSKQGGQLASKMRFLSAPWLALLETGAWLDNARHANAMARHLAAGVADVARVRPLFEVQANSVFLRMPPPIQHALRDKGWVFHTFIGEEGVRFVCSWSTTRRMIDALIADLHQVTRAA